MDDAAFLILGALSRGVSVNHFMLSALEDRWEKFEQPLYVMG